MMDEKALEALRHKYSTTKFAGQLMNALQRSGNKKLVGLWKSSLQPRNNQQPRPVQKES